MAKVNQPPSNARMQLERIPLLFAPALASFMPSDFVWCYLSTSWHGLSVVAVWRFRWSTFVLLQLRVVIGFGWLPLFGIDVVALDRVAHCCSVSHG